MNKIIVITAPSGSGKTTLVKEMLREYSELSFSISVCTRDKRENEIDGKDYYFKTPQEFKELINSGKFVEWEMVYENKYYGTLKSEFERIWKEDKTPIVDIDVVGAMSIKEVYKDAITIFIKVPLEILRERLEDRGTETPESIEERIKKAENEILRQDEFDVVIINKDFIVAVDDIRKEIRKYLFNEDR